MWTKLFIIIIAAALCWMAYHTAKHNPESFSKENIGKSFYTLGWLALFLIAFVAFLVMMVKG